MAWWYGVVVQVVWYSTGHTCGAHHTQYAEYCTVHGVHGVWPRGVVYLNRLGVSLYTLLPLSRMNQYPLPFSHGLYDTTVW